MATLIWYRGFYPPSSKLIYDETAADRVKAESGTYDCLDTSPPGGVQSMVMGISVCLFARITRKLYGRTSPNFWTCCPRPYVARCPSDCFAIHYVLPVLRMTSYFHTMGQIGRIKQDVMFKRVWTSVTTTVFGWVRQNAASGQSLLSRIAMSSFITQSRWWWMRCFAVPLVPRWSRSPSCVLPVVTMSSVKLT